MNLLKLALTAAAGTLAACGQSGSEANAAASRTTAKPFEVAGVTTGMQLAAAEAAMRRGGWTVRRRPGRSWNQEVAAEIGRQTKRYSFDTGDGVEAIEGSKGEERLYVEMRPTPDGGQVSKVTYSAPIAGRTSEQFVAETVRRYGKPFQDFAIGHGSGATFCTGGDRCGGKDADVGRPQLVAGYDPSTSGRVSIELSEGRTAQDAWEKRRNDAAASRLGGAKSSF